MYTLKKESVTSQFAQKELNQSKYCLYLPQSKKLQFFEEEITFAQEFNLYKSNVCAFQKVAAFHHSKTNLVGRHPTPLPCIKSSPSTMVNHLCSNKYSTVHSME